MKRNIKTITPRPFNVCGHYELAPEVCAGSWLANRVPFCWGAPAGAEQRASGAAIDAASSPRRKKKRQCTEAPTPPEPEPTTAPGPAGVADLCLSEEAAPVAGEAASAGEAAGPPPIDWSLRWYEIFGVTRTSPRSKRPT